MFAARQQRSTPSPSRDGSGRLPAPIPLKGHSGASVMLLQEGGVHIVRKTAGGPAQNQRLLGQAEKQRQLLYSGLPFPAVLQSGLDQELAFFDMEYVPGRTVANIVCEAAPFLTDAVLGALQRLFDLFRLTAGSSLDPGLFRQKIEQISACRSAAAAKHAKDVAAIAERLTRLSWEGIPRSECHGDLTLENILVSGNRRVVFIDCDDCFASSWWLDAAKLFQDAAGHWCLRHFHLAGDRGAAMLNAAEHLDALATQLHALVAAADRDLSDRLPQLTALHLFRTIPYAKDVRVVAFVLARISAVLDRAEL